MLGDGNSSLGDTYSLLVNAGGGESAGVVHAEAQLMSARRALLTQRLPAWLVHCLPAGATDSAASSRRELATALLSLAAPSLEALMRPVGGTKARAK